MSLRVSRATFLRVCGTALLGAGADPGALVGLPVSPLLAASSPDRSRFLAQHATAGSFRPHLNSSFAVRAADGRAARFVLAEVAERPISKNVEQFSLIFHAPADAAVREGTHTFAHAALGDFSLFIVPVGAANRRRSVYQACFSRQLSARDLRARTALTTPDLLEDVH